MAIGPREAWGLNEEERKILAELEGEIDLFLKETYKGEQKITFNYNGVLSDRLTFEIEKIYKDAGWRHVSYGKISPTESSIDFYN